MQLNLRPDSSILQVLEEIVKQMGLMQLEMTVLYNMLNYLLRDSAGNILYDGVKVIEYIIRHFSAAYIENYMSTLVDKLKEAGWTPVQIILELVMEKVEVLNLSTIFVLKEKFGAGTMISYLSDIIDILKEYLDPDKVIFVLQPLGDVVSVITEMLNKYNPGELSGYVVQMVDELIGAGKNLVEILSMIVPKMGNNAFAAIMNILDKFNADTIAGSISQIVACFANYTTRNPIEVIDELVTKLGAEKIPDIITAVVAEFEASVLTLSNYLSEIISKLNVAGLNPIQIIDLLLSNPGFNAHNIITAVVDKFTAGELVSHIRDLANRLKVKADKDILDIFTVLKDKSIDVLIFVPEVLKEYTETELLPRLGDVVQRLMAYYVHDPIQIIDWLMERVNVVAAVKAVLSKFGTNVITSNIVGIISRLIDVIPSDDPLEAAEYLLNEIGFTAEQVALALVELFKNITMNQLADILNYFVTEVNKLYQAFAAVYDYFDDILPVYNSVEQFAADFLKWVGKTQKQIAQVFKELFNWEPEQTVSFFYGNGIFTDPMDLAIVLKEVYGIFYAIQTASILHEILPEVQDVAKDIANALVDIYNLGENSLRYVLEQAGFAATIIEDVIDFLRDFLGDLWPFD
jgi:hypothetical protein